MRDDDGGTLEVRPASGSRLSLSEMRGELRLARTGSFYSEPSRAMSALPPVAAPRSPAPRASPPPRAATPAGAAAWDNTIVRMIPQYDAATDAYCPLAGTPQFHPHRVRAELEARERAQRASAHAPPSPPPPPPHQSAAGRGQSTGENFHPVLGALSLAPTRPGTAGGAAGRLGSAGNADAKKASLAATALMAPSAVGAESRALKLAVKRSIAVREFALQELRACLAAVAHADRLVYGVAGRLGQSNGGVWEVAKAVRARADARRPMPPPGAMRKLLALQADVPLRVAWVRVATADVVENVTRWRKRIAASTHYTGAPRGGNAVGGAHSAGGSAGVGVPEAFVWEGVSYTAKMVGDTAFAGLGGAADPLLVRSFGLVPREEGSAAGPPAALLHAPPALRLANRAASVRSPRRTHPAAAHTADELRRMFAAEAVLFAEATAVRARAPEPRAVVVEEALMLALHGALFDELNLTALAVDLAALRAAYRLEAGEPDEAARRIQIAARRKARRQRARAARAALVAAAVAAAARAVLDAEQRAAHDAAARVIQRRAAPFVARARAAAEAERLLRNPPPQWSEVRAAKAARGARSAVGVRVVSPRARGALPPLALRSGGGALAGGARGADADADGDADADESDEDDERLAVWDDDQRGAAPQPLSVADAERAVAIAQELSEAEVERGAVRSLVDSHLLGLRAHHGAWEAAARPSAPRSAAGAEAGLVPAALSPARMRARVLLARLDRHARQEAAVLEGARLLLAQVEADLEGGRVGGGGAHRGPAPGCGASAATDAGARDTRERPGTAPGELSPARALSRSHGPPGFSARAHERAPARGALAHTPVVAAADGGVDAEAAELVAVASVWAAADAAGAAPSGAAAAHAPSGAVAALPSRLPALAPVGAAAAASGAWPSGAMAAQADRASSLAPVGAAAAASSGAPRHGASTHAPTGKVAASPSRAPYLAPDGAAATAGGGGPSRAAAAHAPTGTVATRAARTPALTAVRAAVDPAAVRGAAALSAASRDASALVLAVDADDDREFAQLEADLLRMEPMLMAMVDAVRMLSATQACEADGVEDVSADGKVQLTFADRLAQATRADMMTPRTHWLEAAAASVCAADPVADEAADASTSAGSANAAVDAAAAQPPLRVKSVAQAVAADVATPRARRLETTAVGSLADDASAVADAVARAAPAGAATGAADLQPMPLAQAPAVDVGHLAADSPAGAAIDGRASADRATATVAAAQPLAEAPAADDAPARTQQLEEPEAVVTPLVRPLDAATLAPPSAAAAPASERAALDRQHSAQDPISRQQSARAEVEGAPAAQWLHAPLLDRLLALCRSIDGAARDAAAAGREYRLAVETGYALEDALADLAALAAALVVDEAALDAMGVEQREAARARASADAHECYAAFAEADLLAQLLRLLHACLPDPPPPPPPEGRAAALASRAAALREAQAVGVARTALTELDATVLAAANALAVAAVAAAAAAAAGARLGGASPYASQLGLTIVANLASIDAPEALGTALFDAGALEYAYDALDASRVLDASLTLARAADPTAADGGGDGGGGGVVDRQMAFYALAAIRSLLGAPALRAPHRVDVAHAALARARAVRQLRALASTSGGEDSALGDISAEAFANLVRSPAVRVWKRLVKLQAYARGRAVRAAHSKDWARLPASRAARVGSNATPTHH